MNPHRSRCEPEAFTSCPIRRLRIGTVNRSSSAAPAREPIISILATPTDICTPSPQRLATLHRKYTDHVRVYDLGAMREHEGKQEDTDSGSPSTASIRDHVKDFE